MPEQFLTVKEFAARAGVTTQRIYQALADSLQSYCKVENGRKYIDSAALQVFAADADLPSTCKAFTKHLQSDSEQAPEQLDTLRAQIAAQSAQLDALREQLGEATQAAAVATAERDAERRRADEATAALQSALGAVNAAQQHAQTLAEALTAAQALHAGQIQLAMQPEQIADTQSAGADAPEKSPGFFGRLFKRKK